MKRSAPYLKQSRYNINKHEHNEHNKHNEHNEHNKHNEHNEHNKHNEHNEHKYSFTAVSGYWIINNKHNNNEFRKWLHNTLQINCPYVFFGNDESLNIIKSIRESINNFPSVYINLNIEDFYTYKYKDFIKTHQQHCPSIELNMIWNEKIFLIQKASKLNPFNTESFAWIDAGISTYRNKKPSPNIFPNVRKFESLPKDKMICCPTDSPIFNRNMALSSQYYHYISGNYIVSKSILDIIVELFSKYLDNYMNKNDWKYTDQVIWTKIYTNHPELFHIIGKSYGDIWNFLI